MFGIHLGLFFPLGLFKDRCTEWRGFQSLTDVFLALTSIFIAPVVSVLLAAASLVCSVYQAGAGQFKESAYCLLLALGYTVMAPLSPVIALGSFIFRGMRSLYDLSRVFYQKDDKKRTKETAPAESVEKKTNTELHLETEAVTEKNEAPKSISEIYKERRRALTFFSHNKSNHDITLENHGIVFKKI